MPPSDLNIARSAPQWISLHGDNATAKAREMVTTRAMIAARMATAKSGDRTDLMEISTRPLTTQDTAERRGTDATSALS
jgi:hypothetical protein